MTASILSKYEVQSVINAVGNATRYGGCRTFPEAAQAMVDASSLFVDLDTLHRQVGRHIAALLNVEGALVTTGAAAALLQAAAGCMTGTDSYLISRLPQNPPLRREIIIHHSHRYAYDKSILTSGAALVEVGSSIKTRDWELRGAINERTAAICYLMKMDELGAALSLEETINIAHEHDLPVIVDAAKKLPPKSNLWEFVHQGADLVIFSGGKEMRGPQSSGLMVGRGDLIEAAFLNGTPNQAVGRPMKAGKEIVLGLAAGLACYLEEDEEARLASWGRMQKAFIAALDGCAGWQVHPYHAAHPVLAASYFPSVALYPPNNDSSQIQWLANELAGGEQCIVVMCTRDAILINPMTLDEDEAHIVIERIITILVR